MTACTPMAYLTLRERIDLADEVIAAIYGRLNMNRMERKELETMLAVQLMKRTELRGRKMRPR